MGTCVCVCVTTYNMKRIQTFKRLFDFSEESFSGGNEKIRW